LAFALRKSARPQGLVLQINEKPITGYAASEMLGHACIRASVKHIGWHKLRHTFASQLVGRGVNLRSVQELLGHSTIQMTERYVHLTQSSLQQVILVLEQPQKSESLGNPWAMVLMQQVRDMELPKLKMVTDARK